MIVIEVNRDSIATKVKFDTVCLRDLSTNDPIGQRPGRLPRRSQLAEFELPFPYYLLVVVVWSCAAAKPVMSVVNERRRRPRSGLKSRDEFTRHTQG